MKKTMGMVCLLAATSFLPSAQAQDDADRPPLAVGEALSAATLPLLCGQVIGRYGPGLPQANQDVVSQTVFDLKALDGMGPLLDDAVEKLVTGLTLCLTAAQTPNTVVVLASHVARCAPANARAANLLGTALHTVNELPAATAVMQYALTLEPQSVLLMLNLANIHLDADRDEDARALLDTVLEADDTNQDAWQATACYWYRKQDWQKAWDALLKGAQFGGVVRKAQEKQAEEVKQHPVQTSDSPEAAEAKLEGLKDLHPATMADVIEYQYPAEASRIRERYTRLTGNERLALPDLPQVNLNSARAFQENSAVLLEWRTAVLERLEQFLERVAQTTPDAEPNGDEAPAAGATSDEGAADQQDSEDDEAGADDESTMDEGAAADEDYTEGDGPTMPVTDTGGPFCSTNYAYFLFVKNSHWHCILRRLSDDQPRIEEIQRVYRQRVDAERERFSDEMEKLGREHDNGGGHGEDDLPCWRARLAHRKALNLLANTYYPQWSELYFPHYAQHFKKLVEGLWNTSAPWVKCIHDPAVMRFAYRELAQETYHAAELALDGCDEGGAFEYGGDTDEEEQAIQKAQEAADKEAKEKAQQFRQSVQAPESGLGDWLKEHLVIDISSGVLGLKITAHSIEFKAWFGGISGTAKYELEGDYIETATGVGPRLDIGAEVSGVGLKLTARGDIARKTARFGLSDGSYSESYDADLEVKGTAGVLQGKVDVTVDPELHARARGEMSVGKILRGRAGGGWQR